MQTPEEKIQWVRLASEKQESLCLLDYLTAGPVLLKLFNDPSGNQSDVGAFMEQNPILCQEVSVLIGLLEKTSEQKCTMLDHDHTSIQFIGTFCKLPFYLYNKKGDTSIRIGGPMSMENDGVACTRWINALKQRLVGEL